MVGKCLINVLTDICLLRTKFNPIYKQFYNKSLEQLVRGFFIAMSLSVASLLLK